MEIIEREFVGAEYEPLAAGSEPLSIAYPEDFAHVMGLVRTLMAADQLEYSPRVMRLLEAAASLNPADYSVWHYRLLVLTKENFDEYEEWVNERALLARLLSSFPKNYQLWQHLRAVFARLLSFAAASKHDGLATNEVPESSKKSAAHMLRSERALVSFTLLNSDAKNYHAWSHRMWCAKQALSCDTREHTLSELDQDEFLREELQFCDDMILQDLWNNSAWNYRFELKRRELLRQSLVGTSAAWHEIEVGLRALEQSWANESACSYVRAVMDTVRDQGAARSMWNEVLNRAKDSCPGLPPTKLRFFGISGLALLASSCEVLMATESTQRPLFFDIVKTLRDIDPLKRAYWQDRMRIFELTEGAGP